LRIRGGALGRRSESEPLLIPGCQQRSQNQQHKQANAQRQTWAPRSGAPLTTGRLGCPQRPGAMATHQASSQAAIRLNRPAAAVGTGHRSESHQRVPASRQPQGQAREGPWRPRWRWCRPCWMLSPQPSWRQGPAVAADFPRCDPSRVVATPGLRRRVHGQHLRHHAGYGPAPTRPKRQEKVLPDLHWKW
jgi:hypothetical protein